jgi:hypothetical protein
LRLFGGRDFHVYEQPNSKHNEPMDPNLVNITLDRHNLLTFRVTRDDAIVIKKWRNVWLSYFNWFIHTKNTSETVDSNDSIIMGTMNEFLELNKKLYSTIRN